MIRFLYIDLFCGAGGTSTGVEAARLHGEQVAKVIACVNHDANAIASHAANHPDALHFVEDIRTLNLDRLLAHVEVSRKQYPAARVVLWASLECTNFSIAKGGQSRDADSRTLAEHLFRYIDALRPDYIQIENVKEFMTWGPLAVKVVEASHGHGAYCPLKIKTVGQGKHKRRTIAPVWVPDATRRGEDYHRWVACICKDGGYRFDHRILDSADFGAYTSRRRFFGIFAAGQLPIVFPTPTHTKKPAPNLFDVRAKWRPVRDVLDLHDEGASIFGRKKPLVDATFERIYAGLVKFVAGGKEAFMVKYNSMSQSGKYVAPGIDDPCPTVAVQSRLGVAKACFLAKHFSGSPADRAISIDGPAHAITTVDHHALVSGNFLTAYYGNGYNSPVEAPAPTVTTKDRFQLVRPRFLNMQYGNGCTASVELPAGTVTPTPKHHLVTYCAETPPRKGRYLLNPQFASAGAPIDRPCFTLIARMDKRPPSIVTTENDVQHLAPFIRREGDTLIYEVYTTDSPIVVQIKEFMALYGLVDVKMRMLKISELKRIMGFPANYKLVGTQAEQKKFIGNAVEVNCVVIDNPPFSIVSQIVRFYLKRGIKFFLFAPHLTLFSADLDCTRIVCGAAIVYENGAKVNTSFLSNMFGEAGVIGDPVLYEGIDAICSAPKAELPKYKYPDCVLTVSDVAYIVKNKGEIKIDKREMVHHSALDIQKKHGKSIYGSGFLISYTAAERVTAERAAVKKEAIVWELSEREMRIVEKLSGQ